MFTVFQAFMPHQMRNKHSHKTKVDIFCKTGTHDRSGYFFTARKGKNIFDAPIKTICMRTRIKQITLCHNGSRYWGAFPWLFLLWWCAKNDELTDLYAYLHPSTTGRWRKWRGHVRWSLYLPESCTEIKLTLPGWNVLPGWKAWKLV